MSKGYRSLALPARRLLGVGQPKGLIILPFFFVFSPALNLSQPAVPREALDPHQGLSEQSLEGTDVLLYWGHAAHDAVQDQTVDRIQKRVLDGMGFIPLHSAHWSKIFKRLMGTSCALCYREAGERERVWNVNPGYPIAKGIGDYLELPESEMYGEPFGIPLPDEQIFISWFQGGEVFRSGNCWTRGSGRI